MKNKYFYNIRVETVVGSEIMCGVAEVDIALAPLSVFFSDLARRECRGFDINVHQVEIRAFTPLTFNKVDCDQVLSHE